MLVVLGVAVCTTVLGAVLANFTDLHQGIITAILIAFVSAVADTIAVVTYLKGRG